MGQATKGQSRETATSGEHGRATKGQGAVWLTGQSLSAAPMRATPPERRVLGIVELGGRPGRVDESTRAKRVQVGQSDRPGPELAQSPFDSGDGTGAWQVARRTSVSTGLGIRRSGHSGPCVSSAPTV